MITYVNSKEAKLFELAAEDLRKAGIEVNDLDLDQYLNKLDDLWRISPKYVRLPLYEEGHEDEEIFEIDANARSIKIPASFSRNGIGVVSDQFAEILWFKINRYFDIKDFGKASDTEVLDDGDLHILIQWEAPDGTKGASFAFAIDKDTDPDYIYFGWAITADHLTAKAGNIRFAVRIMQYDELDGKISYSFATQAAAVAVKGNLDFDLTEKGIVIEEVADKISSRLMGGQIAHCPVFAQGGDLPTYIVDLVAPVDDPDAPAQAVLNVVAAAPGDESYDAMAYKWYKKGANDDDFAQIEGEYSPSLTVTSSGQYYVVVFGMREIVDNKEYIFDGEDVSEEKVKFKYHTSIASSKSTVCEIPAPIKLDIQPFVDPEDPTKILGYMARKLVIGKDGELIILINRQEIEQEVEGERVKVPVGDIELRFEKTASADKSLDLETAEFVPVELTLVEGHEAYPERWTYDSEPYSTEAEAKAAADADQGVEAGEGDYSGIVHLPAEDAVPDHQTPISYEVEGGTVTIDMSEAEEGYYKVYVVNKLNGDEEITLAFNKKPEGGVELVKDAVCRIVKPASVEDCAAKIIDIRGNEIQGKGSSNPQIKDRISANVTINGLSDELEIKWYKVAGGHQDKEPPVEGDLAEDILIEDASGEVYIPDDDGFFYFVAINKVEDTEFALASNVVEFTA